MNIRATVLALPVAVALAAASASASPVRLSPIGPAQHTQVAAAGPSSCPVTAAPAEITRPFFEYPAIAKMLGAEGIASVGLSLSANGRVTRTWLIGTTGNPMLDRAALATAHESSYVAEQVHCSPVSGEYKIEVDFALDQ